MIKKVSVIAVCTLFFISVYAQTQKGNVLLGSNFQLVTANSISVGATSSSGFSFGTINGTATVDGVSVTSGIKTRAFNLEPTLGYFVANGLALGAGVRYSSYNASDKDNDSKIGYTSVGVAPFARYYIKGNAKMQPYAELRGGIMRNKTTFSDNGEKDEDTEKPAFWGGRAGISFFFNQNVALDLFGAFEQLRQTDKDIVLGLNVTNKTVANSFGLGLGLSIFL